MNSAIEQSVVIQAYNAGRTLPACLAALAQQSVPRSSYELIVVDDGSTDDTCAVARDAGADQVLCCQHAGPAQARNRGVARAAGDIILFLDADCEPLPDWIEQMTSPFADRSVAGVKGAYRTRQPDVVARLAQCEFEERYDLLEKSERIDFVDSYSAAFRASIFRASGGFDPAFPFANNEDVDLSYRLANAGHRLVFNRRAVVYHRHRRTWGSYLRVKMRRGYWRMLVYRLYPGKAVRDTYTPQLLKVQVLLAYLLGGASVLALAWRRLRAGAVLALGTLLATSVPFTRVVRRTDPAVANWAPLFVVLRAMAFAAGTAGGLLGMFFFRPALPGRTGRSGADLTGGGQCL